MEEMTGTRWRLLPLGSRNWCGLFFSTVISQVWDELKLFYKWEQYQMKKGEIHTQNTNGVAQWNSVMSAISHFFSPFPHNSLQPWPFSKRSRYLKQDEQVYLIICLKFGIAKVFDQRVAKSPEGMDKRDSTMISASGLS